MAHAQYTHLPYLFQYLGCSTHLTAVRPRRDLPKVAALLTVGAIVRRLSVGFFIMADEITLLHSWCVLLQRGVMPVLARCHRVLDA